MSIIETLLSKHPVRKTKAQKEAFRAWMTEEAARMGYTARVESVSSLLKCHNVVIGDPEKADVTFTAHYDTPAKMPFPNFITPCNIPVFMGYQMLPVLAMIVVCFAAAFGVAATTGDAELASKVAFVVYLLLFALLLWLMMGGKPNPNCANDNTSGVAAVLELMARIPAEKRDSVAFILFDNEEMGLLGSSGYAGKHKAVKKDKLIINMDCVGDGETVLFFANKKTRALPAYEKLAAAMQSQSGRSLELCRMEKCMYPSDQGNFRFGVAVCACRKGKRIGYYCDKIHTPKDTVCEQVNLDFIADGLAQFVETL